MRKLRSSAVLAAVCVLTAAAPPPELAERIGCYVGARSEPLRAQVAAGRAPLLVINGQPSGPLRYDAARCGRMDLRGLQVGEIRLLRPSSARDLFGEAAAHGAVIVDYVPPPPPRR